jgi:hypothetical protein
MAETYESFDSMLAGFGVVTVMDAHIYALAEEKTYLNGGVAMDPSMFVKTNEVLDTLKIANFTQEGPTKTITGGQYANPLIKYGKTMTCEMQDALGRASTLARFFGCEYTKGTGRLSITDKFPGAFAIEGRTFFINQKTGEKEWVWIFIPQFLPDAILTLTQDAEGDATVFDLNGSVAVTEIADSAEDAKVDDKCRSIFYEIRKESWFKSLQQS